MPAPSWHSLSPHAGVGVTLPVTALALPGRTSLLSRVCPSRAVNGDFNRLWVICCSNYPMSLLTVAVETELQGRGVCGSQSTQSAAFSLGDSHGNCSGRCIPHLSLGDAGSWMPDPGCWKQLGSVPGPAGVSLTQAGVRKCFLQRNRCQAKLLRLFCQRCGVVLVGRGRAGRWQWRCHIPGDSAGWPRHPEDTGWHECAGCEAVTPPGLAAKL